MTFPSDTESVEYQIRLDAAVALQNLAELTNATRSFDTQLSATTQTVKNFSAQWGMNFQQAKDTLQGLDAEISGTADSSVVFGARGQEAWNSVGTAAETAGKKTTQASQSMVSGINLVRTALHILAASAIFAVINAFTQLFSMAIKGLRELETATYNLTNAERTLSEQGVEITPKGLDETIKKLIQIDPLLSKIQATEVVSRVSSLVAPSVGFKAKEIDQLSQAIAVLAVRNKGLGKSFEEVESQVSNAFLSGRVSVGINQLGVKITDQIVKEEALRRGLVKTGDEFDKLTGKMEANIKARAMLSILTQNTAEDMKHLPDYFKTADAAFGVFQARFQDLMTLVGKEFGPILIRLFELLTYSAMGWLEILEKVRPVLERITAYAVGISDVLLSLGKGVDLNPFTQIKNMKDTFSKGVSDTKNYFKDFADAVDTATSSTNSFSSSVDGMSKATADAKVKVADLAKEMQDKLADIERQYSDKLADIATNYNDKLADINTKAADKRVDAETDYNNKVADINRDSNDKVASAQQDYRQKEIDREQEYQNKLKELRQKFLFDLEDALRERDARAVLRLLRQYQMDKKAAEDKNKLDRQQNKQELQQKLQEIEVERQQKLEAARREYEDKLKEIQLAQQRELDELNVWRQRELRDASTWHQRQLEEQRIYLQRKLRDLADAIAREYQLTAAGAAAINSLLQGYFGSTGSLLSGFSSSLNNTLSGIVSGSGASTSTSSTFGSHLNVGIGSGLYNPYDVRSRGGFAEGGTLLATRPTTVTFGETPEIATFTPITRAGQNMNDLVTSLGSGSGAGGNANIVLRLSPELKAEIIENSLDSVALHLERLTRVE